MNKFFDLIYKLYMNLMNMLQCTRIAQTNRSIKICLSVNLFVRLLLLLLCADLFVLFCFVLNRIGQIRVKCVPNK